MEPLGITHLEFAESGNHYTWRKVRTVVHNIVIGKLWIDQVIILTYKAWCAFVPLLNVLFLLFKVPKRGNTI